MEFNLEMKFLQRARPNVVRLATVRNATIAILGAFGILTPTLALASEGDNVVLHFGSEDSMMLWMAFAIGVIAYVYALVLRGKLLKEAAGSEKMREVGAAIHDGALAYLKQQITTMSIFIVILAAGLFGLFLSSGPLTAGLVALCFVLGVSGSYFSGYSGMLMAVASNMRVANAALTSPKKALEIAFQSGGVAGLFTVGIALMGATLILLFGGAHATTLLVGFGFGGSLAALFMRVGGGIFTKAADVGADLVGKVEAGIPEDDPRNPAVIADNVGDNVGDCAGMVADVFESYEVTLVSAIVLGAASSIVFDQATWTRLIVFALVVSGLGLAASMIAISLVKGSDDPKDSPLDSITKGLKIAAVTAGVFTLGGTWFLMGGRSNPIHTTELFSSTSAIGTEIRAIHGIRDSIASAAKKKPSEVTADDIIKSKEATALGIQQNQSDTMFVTQALHQDESVLPESKTLAGYQKITDPNDQRVAKLSAVIPQDPSRPPTNASDLFQTLGAALVGSVSDPLDAVQIQFTGDSLAKPSAGGQPPRAAQKIDLTTVIGPNKHSINLKKVEDIIAHERVDIPNLSYTIKATYPAHLYVSGEGKPMLVVDSGVKTPHAVLLPYQQGQPLTYLEGDPKTLNDTAHNPPAGSPGMPTQQPIDLGFSQHADVPWWLFFCPIGFGIVMSIVLQMLTDYYVSTHRKPTQEVAGVSNAGPAPMIIQGFAYGAESAVFMTVAIVISLMFPLFFFPAAKYGGYILSFYGIALVGLGLLTPTAFVLAMDTFGPISDNAQGVFEMSGEAELNPVGAHALQQLDAAGNTTKALTKGFAIATAVIASAALFHSFVDSAQLNSVGLRLDVPEIFLGLLLGGAAPYLFSAFTINAVGRAAFELIHEVRRQFRSDPGIMAGTSKPDYAKCVALVTAAAQKELLGPGILAIALPVAVAFGFSIGKPATYINGHYYNLTGAEALGGFLAGAIVSGQLMAVMLSNAGGMWDNAKKLIEDGMYGGKGSEAHKASVVCDTVGDPFKDTAGPALNPLIKVMNLVALLLAGVIVRPYGDLTLSIVTGIAVALLAVSIIVSKKGSMSEQMKAATSEAHRHDDHLIAIEHGAADSAASASAPKTSSKKKITVESDEPESKV
jgi:K(+)-stimulated pyrophosphate-energized sodium pump